MKSVLLLIDNLFFRQKLAAQLKELGYGAVFEPAGEFSAVIVDLAPRNLNAADVIRKMKGDSETSKIPIIGFCGHAETARMETARAAGCDIVTTNGVISSGLGGLLEKIGGAGRI